MSCVGVRNTLQLLQAHSDRQEADPALLRNRETIIQTSDEFGRYGGCGGAGAEIRYLSDQAAHSSRLNTGRLPNDFRAFPRSLILVAYLGSRIRWTVSRSTSSWSARSVI